MKRVILPNVCLGIFETEFDVHEDRAMDHVRHELASITVIAQGRDIYDNRITIERTCQWFARNMAGKE